MRDASLRFIMRITLSVVSLSVVSLSVVSLGVVFLLLRSGLLIDMTFPPAQALFETPRALRTVG